MHLSSVLCPSPRYGGWPCTVQAAAVTGGGGSGSGLSPRLSVDQDPVTGGHQPASRALLYRDIGDHINIFVTWTADTCPSTFCSINELVFARASIPWFKMDYLSASNILLWQCFFVDLDKTLKFCPLFWWSPISLQSFWSWSSAAMLQCCSIAAESELHRENKTFTPGNCMWHFMWHFYFQTYDNKTPAVFQITSGLLLVIGSKSDQSVSRLQRFSMRQNGETVQTPGRSLRWGWCQCPDLSLVPG